MARGDRIIDHDKDSAGHLDDSVGERDRQSYTHESAPTEEAYSGKHHHDVEDYHNRGNRSDHIHHGEEKHPQPQDHQTPEFHSRSGVIRRK